MKIFLHILLPLILLFGLVIGQPQENPKEFLHSFVQGRYELIGRWPDSDSLYSGTAIIRGEGKHLQMIRTVNGQTTTCKALIEAAPIAETQVLRAYFSVNAIHYEATYLIQADLDNYARLSGYIYQKGNKTRRPGLEVLFVKQK